MSNLQAELLKLYSQNLTDEQLIKIKELINNYLISIKNDNSALKKLQKSKSGHKPVYGSAKGLIKVSDDFDENLEDFKEYSK
jgi:hypothetical protein